MTTLFSLLRSANSEGLYDAADRGALESLHNELSRRAESLARESAESQAAAGRIAAGTYGTCESCACSIPVARMIALPTARLCLECQEELETNIENGKWRIPKRTLMISSAMRDRR